MEQEEEEEEEKARLSDVSWELIRGRRMGAQQEKSAIVLPDLFFHIHWAVWHYGLTYVQMLFYESSHLIYQMFCVNW